jgi:hypothetical protein
VVEVVVVFENEPLEYFLEYVIDRIRRKGMKVSDTIGRRWLHEHE